jgi:curli biogenesis system outer membrane secretion channel CsgG
MKRIVIWLVVALAMVASSQAFAGGKPRLGVLRFTNNTSAAWWYGTAGTDLQDMLIAELAGMKVFNVLERKEIDAVLGEQDLAASGRVNKSTAAKVGKITGAKYLVAATVSAFEKNTGADGAGISFGGFSIGGKREQAYIAVDLKVINAETGEITHARTVEASSKDTGLNFGVSLGGFGGSLGKEKKTPTGKAIRASIMEIAEYLECSMVKGKNDSCMQEYEAKESSRRERTKGSISLE